MAIHNQLGIDGEQLALNHLIDKGYIIKEHNWRCGKLEIDIIARKDKELVFVEVKSRRDIEYAHPSDAIDDKKMRNLISAADVYIKKFNIPFDIRFDVISVIVNGTHTTIEHIEDAFFPPIWR
ncbi:MAG: YraN family protein [Bacteroidales bacterium]